MSKSEKQKYQVNRHFHFEGRVYGRNDQPEFTKKQADEILAAQEPKPDGDKIKPVIAPLATATNKPQPAR